MLLLLPLHGWHPLLASPTAATCCCCCWLTFMVMTSLPSSSPSFTQRSTLFKLSSLYSTGELQQQQQQPAPVDSALVTPARAEYRETCNMALCVQGSWPR